MLLAEEYVRRHSLDVKVIPQTKRITIFGKKNDQWLLLRLINTERKYHPSYFQYYCGGIEHNGYAKNGSKNEYWYSVFAPLQPDASTSSLDIEVYEDFVYEWMGDLDYFCTSKKEIFVAAWEMFLIYCDEYIAPRVQNLDLLGKTIDKEQHLSYRYVNIKKMLSHLQLEQDEWYKLWQTIFAADIKNHPIWSH